jgi:hypothetical protein
LFEQYKYVIMIIASLFRLLFCRKGHKQNTTLIPNLAAVSVPYLLRKPTNEKNGRYCLEKGDRYSTEARGHSQFASKAFAVHSSTMKLFSLIVLLLPFLSSAQETPERKRREAEVENSGAMEIRARTQRRVRVKGEAEDKYNSFIDADFFRRAATGGESYSYSMSMSYHHASKGMMKKRS